jgi:negative regulator of sigma E activity
MNEQEQTSQLSALFDGELPSQQAEWVIRRALKDSAMRERWQRYALIGACLRGEPLAGTNDRKSVAERVAARLAAEAEILAPSRGFAGARSAAGRSVTRLVGRGAMGGAIAAAVAVMAVFVVRSMGPAADTSVILASRDTPAAELVAVADPVVAQSGDAAAGEAAPPSYTTPGANSPVANRFVDQQPLAHYVVAHSEQAASAYGFSYDLTEGAVDMTEDEIEARR